MNLDDPETPCVPDHTDYAARVVPLRRWHPDRAAAESTGMTGDARADESLYRPSLLGTAESSLETVPAGHNEPFTLTYRAGARTLAPGTSVHFFMAGQGSLGTAPQIDDPYPCKIAQVGIQVRPASPLILSRIVFNYGHMILRSEALFDKSRIVPSDNYWIG